jgi:mRNA interferase MazF
MRRGELVTIALQGAFGKPRPALVVQNDLISGTDNVLVCPAVPRRKCGPVIGMVTLAEMADIDRRLAFILGLPG